MKNPERILKIIVFAVVLASNLIFPAQNLNGQTVLNNNHLRFGHGSENSVNTLGNLQQPFYYNSTLSLWRKLTFSSYPLDNSFGIDGNGSNEWNLNGSMIQNPPMSSQSIDLSGYVTTTSPNGYGTIVSTGTITIGGKNLEIKNTYELGEDKSFIKITTNIKNISSSNANNVRYWVGTRDDYVGGTDRPLKEKGNLVDGAFAKITNPADRALALRISTSDEGVLFYTNSSKGNNIINSCCDWLNVINTNPQLSTIEITNDGSYGFYVRMNDLSPGTSDEFTWYYASGRLEDLETIIADVAAASGAVSDISYTTATFKAKTSTAGTGYWIVVPRNATAPTELQIKSGVDYGSVDVISSGSGAMLANIDKFFYLTNLEAETNYDLYFVSEDATPAFSSIAKVQFATIAYEIPELTTNSPVTGITQTGATSGGDVTSDGGQSVSARGVCWNTTGSPTIASSKTNDGAGTGSFISAITGLSEGKIYYVRSYATNSVGTAYGNEVSFTTLKVDQTITFADPDNKTYGDAAFELTATSSSGLAVTYSSSDTDVATIAGSTITIVGAGATTITASQAGNSTYNPASDVTVQLNVTKAILIASADPQTKIYGAANPSLTLEYSGFKNGDDAADLTTIPSVSTTITAASAAGLYEDVITVTGGDANNYSFTYIHADFEVTKATLTVTADSKTKVYGSANPDLTYYYAGFVNNDDVSDLNTEPMASATITLTSSVGIYEDNITLAGGDDENYSFSYIPADFEITKAPLTVIADAQTKVYGSANPALTYQYSGFVNDDDASDLTTEPTASSAIILTTSVGVYDDEITLAGGDDENYSFTYVPADFEVTKATLTVTADAQTKVYGSANPPLTYLYYGFLNEDDASDLTTEPIASSSITLTSAAGVYDDEITLADGDDENYSFTYIPADFEVTKATLTVTADAQTKVYGSANPALTYLYTGFLNDDDASDLTTEPTASSSITLSSAAGVYDDEITLADGDDENYNFTYIPADFEITKASLTVTADPQTKIYGAASPALTFQYSGFVNDDDGSDLTTEPTASATITQASSVGIYNDEITVAGGDDENYSFSYFPADFEVTKATLLVTADSKTKVYGSANPDLTLTFAGFKNDEDITVIDILPSVSANIVLLTDAGSYPITVSGGSDNNYELSLVDGEFKVEKALLTIKADSKTRVYGQANPPLTMTWSGFISGQDQTVLDVLPSVMTVANQHSDAGIYDIVVSGGEDNNYNFNYGNGTMDIEKANQVITFTDVPDGLRISEYHQLIATSTSGLPVDFDISDPFIGSVSGDILTINKEGDLNITAFQNGNNNWNSAPLVTQSIVTLPGFDNIMSLFTPNNDGVNDYWYIPDIDQYGGIAVVIYNRFGKKVYQSNSYNNDWDGTWNGSPLPSASYYYIIKSATKGTITGAVNIVR